MGQKVGHPKHGGRKKGTPNKITQTLDEICMTYKVHPFEEMVKLYADAGWDPHMKLAILKELCQYLYPKRKAIEHSGEINNPYLAMPFEDLEKLVKEKLEKKK